MLNLKPCPFCGSTRVQFIDDWYDSDEGDQMVVFCSNCRATSRMIARPSDDNGDYYDSESEYYTDTMEDVISAWNSRVNEQSISEEISDIARKVLSTCKKYCNSINADIDVNDMNNLEEKLDSLEKIQKAEKSANDSSISTSHDTV